jgi:CubicO group peptidase (beta-lactamase class C family)
MGIHTKAWPSSRRPLLRLALATCGVILAAGTASIELGVPLSADHVFRIGSVTKQFTAATLLQKVDAGQAALSDSLATYLLDFPGGKGITLAQLLNHTSGVKSYTGVPGYITGAARADHRRTRRQLPEPAGRLHAGRDLGLQQLGLRAGGRGDRGADEAALVARGGRPAAPAEPGPHPSR